jgi:hypothetical protein
MPRHSLSTMKRVALFTPPSMQAKQPRSRSIVCSTSPPSRTRTQRLFGTSPYQTAPSASRQMPSGTPPSRSAHTRRLDRLPSAPMSNAVSLLPYDSARISVELSGSRRGRWEMRPRPPLAVPSRRGRPTLGFRGRTRRPGSRSLCCRRRHCPGRLRRCRFRGSQRGCSGRHVSPTTRRTAGAARADRKPRR